MAQPSTPMIRYIRKVAEKAKTLYIINADMDNGDPPWDDLRPIQKHLWIQQVKHEGLVHKPESR